MSQFLPLAVSTGGSPVTTRENSRPSTPTPDYIPGCFEGPEKTMEVCFIPGIGEEAGLRQLSRKQLDFLCTEAKCSILSKISSAYMDAYVLSESSLFIYKHRYIMKTCGTTTLLHCLDSLLRFADELKMELMWVGYSRKNLLFPTQQAWPHSNFGDEIEYLNSHKVLQDRLNGVAHILGPVTGDHWFVYVADNPPHMAALVEAHQQQTKNKNKNKNKSRDCLSQMQTLEDNACPQNTDDAKANANGNAISTVIKSKSTSCLSSIPSGNGSGSSCLDLTSSMMTMEGITINMMMFDLDQEVTKLFYQSPPSSSPPEASSSSSPSPTATSTPTSAPTSTSKEEEVPELDSATAAAIGKRMTKAAGIDHLVPGATIDESSFSPCGYSMNAILHDAYSTIHVTPEQECSYASFETNTALRAYSPLVRNALNVFRPQRFVLTMFADEVAYSTLQEGAVPPPLSSRELFVPRIGMYRRTNLSSTNIGVDLNCTMACFTLVTPVGVSDRDSGRGEEGDGVGVGVGVSRNRSDSSDSSEGKEDTEEGWGEKGRGGDVTDVPTRRTRGNTVDLTTPTPVTPVSSGARAVPGAVCV